MVYQPPTRALLVTTERKLLEVTREAPWSHRERCRACPGACPDATPAPTFPHQNSSYSAVVTVYLAPVRAKLATVVVYLALDNTPAPTFRAKFSVRFSVPISRDCVRIARDSVPSTHDCVLSTRDSVLGGRDSVLNTDASVRMPLQRQPSRNQHSVYSAVGRDSVLIARDSVLSTRDSVMNTRCHSSANLPASTFGILSGRDSLSSTCYCVLSTRDSVLSGRGSVLNTHASVPMPLQRQPSRINSQ